jgi:hypothetical protein
MYTTHHPCWDAKNRHDLAPELPFEYANIAHLINSSPAVEAVKSVSAPAPVPTPPQATIPAQLVQLAQSPKQPKASDIPAALADLMKANHVSSEEIQAVVAEKGYYPNNTPIANYDSDFVAGVLVGAWTQVYEMIKARQNDGELPFDTNK